MRDEISFASGLGACVQLVVILRLIYYFVCDNIVFSISVGLNTTEMTLLKIHPCALGALRRIFG